MEFYRVGLSSSIWGKNKKAVNNNHLRSTRQLMAKLRFKSTSLDSTVFY